MSKLPPLTLSDNASLDTCEVWAALTEAHRHLAELKGLCESLPNQGILLDTLSIQEAKDSSEIENIITTHDELFAVQEDSATPAANLEQLTKAGFLRKQRMGKTNFYINEPLFTLLSNVTLDQR